MPGFSIEPSPIGRIVVAPEVPAEHRLFYTTRDYEGAIGEELQAFVGMPIAHCHQVHGRTLCAPAVPPAECDALWSSEPGALAIKTADCLPVSLIAGGVIANIHCGWRGAVQRIVDATLDVVGVTGAAWLGPSIRVCCFEVGEEVAEQFDDAFVDRTRAKPHVDIAGLVAARLRERGVARVHDSVLCTRCEGSIFHSFRRDGRTGGRNLAILAKD
ncbi:MAG TPA: polyphenol oxidase family protein [Thermoanaerobaculia bacterium]|nr:polyphenol oxidase family protein [Thermoanaerobaculia bacterium]